MIRPAYARSRILLRSIALLLVLLVLQHHVAVVADSAALEQPFSVARGAAAVAAAKALHPSGVPGHHASSQAPEPAATAHCGMMEATLAPPVTGGRAEVACRLSSSEAPLLELVLVPSGPPLDPVPVLAHTIRQALLQVFLH